MSSSIWLRVIQINDVYELDNLPSFKTLVDEHRAGPNETLVVLAGDFLAPSLLSSIDQGAGMVDCMNAAGVTHCCFGNHEADVDFKALANRIQQSNFVWVNSNMQDINRILNIETPVYEIVQVSNGSETKLVALLGLLTGDKSLYRPGAFGGASIEPISTCAARLVEDLPSRGVDLILPMTHQSMPQDRDLASQFDGNAMIPIIIGGHDHEPYDELVKASRIIKAGMDAHQAAVIDFKWEADNKSSTPSVSVCLLKTEDYLPDPFLTRKVETHKIILKELDRAKLFSVEDWKGNITNECLAARLEFSTMNNRLSPSLGTTALTTMIRMGTRAQCALMNAGSVRGNKLYNGDFTWSDLKAEMPFPTQITVCYIPGRVLEACIKNSRSGAQEVPPVARGGYLHTCNNIRYSDDTQCIMTIQGKAFDPDMMYLTALPAQFFNGIDNHEALLEWAAGNACNPDEESAIPAKMIVVSVFCSLLWLQLGSFGDIDTGGAGVLYRDDVKRRVEELHGREAADLMVNNIFAVADMNQDGTISPLEMMIAQFVATDLVSHICTMEELKVMKDIAAHVLGKDPLHEDVKLMVAKIREVVDTSKDGKIDREEMMEALGELTRQDLLR